MTQHEKLSEAEINEELSLLFAWSYEDGKLKREIDFPSFPLAFGFMTEMAMISQEMNHHPNWTNIYNKVFIELYTHDAGGVTALDIAWANRCAQQICSER